MKTIIYKCKTCKALMNWNLKNNYKLSKMILFNKTLFKYKINSQYIKWVRFKINFKENQQLWIEII